MSSPSVTHLEPHVDRLISAYNELRLENVRLQKILQRLEAEKAQLLAQHKQAVHQIQQVMTQLREEIHERSA